MRRGCDVCGELLVGDLCPRDEHCNSCCDCLVCERCGQPVDDLPLDGLCEDCAADDAEECDCGCLDPPRRVDIVQTVGGVL